MTDETHNTPTDTAYQAKVISEALPYMRRFTGQTIVIKYGGHAMVNDEMAKLFARDIVMLSLVGAQPVVVHGGGPQIGAMLKKVGVESTFVDGLRVTDQAAVDVVEMVLSGSVNKEIVTNIAQAGGTAVGISGKDGGLIQAERYIHKRTNPETGAVEDVDMGLVGNPKEVDPTVLDVFKDAGLTPVIAPLAAGPEGETLNVNADTAAGAIAAAAKARRMYMLTDVPGVLDKNGDLISEMTATEARARLADGTITGGMIPKIETCLMAIDAGVRGAAILDGRQPHGVLVEMFTSGGAGTLIRADNLEISDT